MAGFGVIMVGRNCSGFRASARFFFVAGTVFTLDMFGFSYCRPLGEKRALMKCLS